MESPASHLQRVLKPNSLTELLSTQGYVVIDHAFGEEWCNVIREEMETLESSDLFLASKNKLAGTQKGHVLEKPGIVELDMIFEGKVVCKPEGK